MKSYASPSPVIISENVEMIDLKKELSEELSDNKKIMVQECYFIKDLKQVIVIAKLVDRSGNSDELMNYPYMSIRFKSECKPTLIETKFHNDHANKNYFDELTKIYSGKEIICFYHCDLNKEMQENEIWVRNLPYSLTPHFKKSDSQTKQDETPNKKISNTWNLSNKIVVGGIGAFLFRLFAANLLGKSETRVDDILDNIPKAGM